MMDAVAGGGGNHSSDCGQERPSLAVPETGSGRPWIRFRASPEKLGGARDQNPDCQTQNRAWFRAGQNPLGGRRTIAIVHSPKPRMLPRRTCLSRPICRPSCAKDTVRSFIQRMSDYCKICNTGSMPKSEHGIQLLVLETSSRVATRFR